jgi:hypothetical protein
MLAPTTTGEKYRKALASIDALCKKRGIGPYVDPSDPQFRSKAAVTDCKVLKVKPFDLNAVLATEEGRFAYSIKLPAPLDKPRVKRTDYATPEEYFDALCRTEAGEYVFRTVDGVEGISALRTPLRPWQYRLGSFSEESGGHTGGPSPEEGLVTLRRPYSYNFVERPARFDERGKASETKYLRFPRQSYSSEGLRGEPIASMSARYGFVWRGVEDWNDRENGIIGGDLLLIETSSLEVLALQRGFTKYEVNSRKIDHVEWTSAACPRTSKAEPQSFILSTLRPE